MNRLQYVEPEARSVENPIKAIWPNGVKEHTAEDAASQVIEFILSKGLKLGVLNLRDEGDGSSSVEISFYI